jgi:hypothetical protein
VSTTQRRDTRIYTITMRVPGIALPADYKPYLFALEFPNVFNFLSQPNCDDSQQSTHSPRSDNSRTTLRVLARVNNSIGKGLNHELK